MGIFFAGLMFFAASSEPAKPVELLSDDAVVNYLVSAGDRAEWNSAKQQDEAGKKRVQTGTSILNTPRAPSAGASQETPEQVKARAQKIIKEGEEQSARAMPSIDRLRKVANARYLELTKTLNYEQPLPQTLWNVSLLQSAVRLQKVARDKGYKTQHLVGAMTILGADRVYRTPVIAKALREAWVKAEPNALAAVPTGGYVFKRSASSNVPQFAAEWVAPSAAGQVALIWAEVYPLTADDSAGLLVVRMADAFTMRVVGSEIYLTTMGPADALPKTFNAAIVLKDDKSFIPRLASSGDWLLSYDRESSPVGVALLRHLCVRIGNLGVGASQTMFDLLGGDLPSNDGAKASWTVSSQPAPGFSKSFKVSSKMPEAQAVLVGEVFLKLENTTPPSKSAGK